jgi:hypothetical protein
MIWRKIVRDSGLIEWECEHGVGHPDDESIREMDNIHGSGSEGSWGIHGCDGCCSRPDFPGKAKTLMEKLQTTYGRGEGQ